MNKGQLKELAFNEICTAIDTGSRIQLINTSNRISSWLIEKILGEKNKGDADIVSISNICYSVNVDIKMVKKAINEYIDKLYKIKGIRQ